jgi:hypothetical protein
VAFIAPDKDLEVGGGFEAPEEDLLLAQDTGQSRLSSKLNELPKGFGTALTRTVSGLGQASQSFVRNLNPVGWLAKAGFKPAQAAVDLYTAPGKAIEEAGNKMTESVERALPTNPAFQEEWSSKIPAAIGQVAGIVAPALVTGGMSALPHAARLAQAAPFVQGYLLGTNSGYAEADRQGITDPLARDAMAAAFGAAEAGVERLGGIGGKAFSERLFGEVTKRGGESFVKRLTKTALTEGVEEPITGEAQDIAANIFGNENAPEWSLFDPDVLARRGEEFALGAIAGGPVGLIDALASRRNPDDAAPAVDEAPIQSTEGEVAEIPKGYIEVEDSGLNVGDTFMHGDEGSSRQGVYRVNSVVETTADGKTVRKVRARPVASSEVAPEAAPASGFDAPDKDLGPSEAITLESRARLDGSIRAMGNDELREAIEWSKSLPNDPEWADVSSRLQAEELRRESEQLAAMQPDEGGGLGEQLESPLTKEAEELLFSIASTGAQPAFISKNLERIAAENGVAITGSMRPEDVIAELVKKRSQEPAPPPSSVEDLQSANNSLDQARADMVDLDNRIAGARGYGASQGPPVPPQESGAAAALEADAVAQAQAARPVGPIIPTGPVAAPTKAVSSPSAASSPVPAPTTLPAPQDAPADKETAKAAPSAPEALDAVTKAEYDLKMAQRLSVSPSVLKHLKDRVDKARADVSQAKIPVVMPDGSVAAAPAVVKGAQGLEPNLAPVSSVAAEEAKAANIREVQEKEKQEAAKAKQKEADDKKAEAEKKKAEKEKSQSTEGADKPATYKMKDYNKTGRVGKGVELPIEQARAKLLQRQSLFNSLKNCLEGKA